MTDKYPGLDPGKALLGGSRVAAAAYLAEQTADLASLARRHGLDALGYILDMAQLEARNATRHVNGHA